MLIGIDDTGGTAIGERFLAVAAFVRPSSMDRVAADFIRWETVTRRGIPRRPTEIKSTLLSEGDRRSFVNDVLAPHRAKLFYRGVGIDVDSHVLAWAEKQRDRTVGQIDGELAKARSDGRKRFANQLTTLRGWMRKTSPAMFVKTMVLNSLVVGSINQAIGTSVALDFDDELGHLRFSIDHGFTRGAPDFWRFVLGSYLMSETQREQVIYIDSWTADHPFLATFVEEIVGPYVMLSQEFKNRINFRDSRDLTEIRIADQIAGLLRRRYVAGDSEPYLRRMKDCALRPEMTLLQVGDLAEFDEPATGLNVFLEIERLREERDSGSRGSAAGSD